MEWFYGALIREWPIDSELFAFSDGVHFGCPYGVPTIVDHDCSWDKVWCNGVVITQQFDRAIVFARFETTPPTHGTTMRLWSNRDTPPLTRTTTKPVARRDPLRTWYLTQISVYPQATTLNFKGAMFSSNVPWIGVMAEGNDAMSGDMSVGEWMRAGILMHPDLQAIIDTSWSVLAPETHFVYPQDIDRRRYPQTAALFQQRFASVWFDTSVAADGTVSTELSPAAERIFETRFGNPATITPPADHQQYATLFDHYLQEHGLKRVAGGAPNGDGMSVTASEDDFHPILGFYRNLVLGFRKSSDGAPCVGSAPSYPPLFTLDDDGTVTYAPNTGEASSTKAPTLDECLEPMYLEPPTQGGDMN